MISANEQLDQYMKIREAAQLWGVSERRVQGLCADGRIPGTIRLGRDWMIPRNAPRPADGRTKSARDAASLPPQTNLPMPRKTPFLYMTDLYSVPGTADQCAEKLAYNPEAQILFEAEVAYSRGQIDKVYSKARYLLKCHTGFYSVISAGMLLALCAIWHGDLEMWRKAKVHIAEASAKDDRDRDLLAFALTCVDSMLYDTTNFPEWFKMGCFEPLHRESLPSARVFYAKYLYVAGYAVATKQAAMDGVQGLSLMSLLPFAVEPMVSQAIADGSVVSEIYLRMICATIYHNSGNDEQAIRHLDRAIPLALADGLYGLLAEYVRVVDSLLEQRVSLVDPQAWLQVRQLYKTYNQGWSKLSGSVRGKNLVTTLSPREREVAKLAAFGMSNAEIAEKLHMSLSGVKQAVRIVSEKTGMSRGEFAAVL